MATNYDKPTDYDQDIAAQNNNTIEKGTAMYDGGVSSTVPTQQKFQNYDFNRRDRMFYNINKTGIVIWDNNTSYIKGSLVFYKERVYVSIANSNKNNDPETSSGDWILIDDHIRITEPSANSLGTIKFLPVVAGSNTALQLATPQEVETLLRPLRYVPYEEWDETKDYSFGDKVTVTTTDSNGVKHCDKWVCVLLSGTAPKGEDNRPDKLVVENGIYKYFHLTWRREKIPVSIYAPPNSKNSTPILIFNLFASGASDTIYGFQFTTEGTQEGRTYRWDSFKDADGNKFIEGTSIMQNGIDPKYTSIIPVTPAFNFNGNSGSEVREVRANASAVNQGEGFNILLKPNGTADLTVQGLIQPMIWSSESSYRKV